MNFQVKANHFYLNDRKAFLNSGEIHYFRIKRELWDQHLQAACEAGLTTVSTYVPWAWHESEEGVFDFDGRSCPERDLKGWLQRCQAKGLTCIVKPGPFILAETRGAGLPDWFLDQFREQVKMRDSKGKIVSSDGVSLFHPKYLEKLTRWYDHVMPFLHEREISAGGPIIMMQICNEIGLFSWLAHQADYGERVRARFIAYLSTTWKSIAELNRRWETAYPDFAHVELPPDGRLPYASKGDRCRDHDWHLFWRTYYGDYLRMLTRMARERGLKVPFYHNLPGWIYGSGYEFPVNITMYEDLFGNKSELFFGVDHIPEFLSHRNMHDDRIINDITSAMQGNKPLFAAEFQCGSREYHVVTNPRELELFYKASIAHGLTGWNYYMFSQGRNPGRRGYSGDTFYWFTPLTAESERSSAFSLIQRMSKIVKTSERVILEAERKAEVCVLFYPPYYATELERPETGASGLQYIASAIRRPAYFDGLLKVLQVLNIDYDMVDLCQASAETLAKYKQVWAFSTDEMNAGDQQTLLSYTRAGGQLVMFPCLPDREMSQAPCTLIRDALSVKPSGTEIIDSPLVDIYNFKDNKCANPQIIYTEQSLAGAEIIARTIGGSPCGFTKPLGHGSIIHLGTWIGFDTEGHKAVYEAILRQSGSKLRQASSSNDHIAVLERFTPGHAAILFIGNYYNEDQEGKVTYTHPESGETIHVPYAQDRMTWPALYGVLTPVCMEVSDGIKILHSTSDILGVALNDGHLDITLHGDRDLAGEIVFEGPGVDRISSATLLGETVRMVRDDKRTAFIYRHKHQEAVTLSVAILTLKNSLGLACEFLANGSLKSIQVDPIRINLKATTPFSRPGTNLYVRKRSKPFEFTALLGPESNSRFNVAHDTFVARGSWAGLDYTCMLQLSTKSLSWRWSVDLRNLSGQEVELDLIYVQDAGLKPLNAGMLNEYYVSQYLERRILVDKTYGAVACCRQNMKESTGHPWFMMACQNAALAGSVDGIQFYGRTYRETGIPEGLLADHLGGEYAGESSVFALQEKPFSLAAGGVHRSAFVGTYRPDHPQATSGEDLNSLPGLMLEFDGEHPAPHTNDLIPPTRNLFNTTPFLPVDDLDEDELNRFFDEPRRHCEYESGRLLSFFSAQNNHVVLRAKEVSADRPHAHIMQARAGYVPDEGIMSTTAFAFGVFHSQLTQGNTNFQVLLSVCTSQFNLAPESGQRIFVEVDGRRYLLGVPSAFEMGLNHCRWIYKHGHHCFQVRSWTSQAAPQVNLDFKVISGNRVSLLITHDFDALNGWTIHPGNQAGEYLAKPRIDSVIAAQFPQARFRIALNSTGADYQVGGDEMLYPHGNGPRGSLFVVAVRETADWCMSFIGEVSSTADAVRFTAPDRQYLSDCRDGQSSWNDLSLKLSLRGTQQDIAAIREILPWYGLNALTHFLTPYGLEQFSGAAWGTRDVSQGPIDLLLTLQKYDAARQVLRIIFSNQDADGGWPQWWMFDRYSKIRSDSAHGDIVYWCLIALSNYVKVTGDLSFLNEVLPYYYEKGPAQAEHAPLSEHVDRLIKRIIASFIPGTAFVPFDGGDWNDSLQPVSKELAQRMISSWTVEMNYQAFSQYQWVYEQAGNTSKAGELKAICERIKADFNRYLVKDGVVAGYGLVADDRSISLLLHPRDTTTGIRYSILPMNRGIISGIFTNEQAQHHQDLIEQHLKGPDGARLMDRPLKYHGGLQTMFQRAESSTFFGREIGLMYMHEHLRYAESQARTGRADAFVKALRQAIPVGYRDVVPCGDIRQSNCYYSSSDVAFSNRYEADELYDGIKTGKFMLRGGWRVYSSGPGIFIGLVVSQLLGLRNEAGNIIVDPVMPYSLDGLSVSMDYLGHGVTWNYAVKEGNFSPRAVSINGKAVQFTLEENKYRLGGAVIPAEQFLAMLDRQENTVEIRL